MLLYPYVYRMRIFLYAVVLFLIGTLLNAEDVESDTPSVVDLTEVPEESSESLMTLEAMVEHIRATSPRVLLEREKVRRELERSKQERAALLPQVSLNASQRRQQTRDLSVLERFCSHLRSYLALCPAHSTVCVD